MNNTVRQDTGFKLAALFGVSITTIAYELAAMRTFSVGSWSNFGSMVISIALLGYGLAGALLTFLRERVERNLDTWLVVPAILLGPAMAGAHWVAQKVPFNPILISTDPTQLVWIGAYYVIYAVPFLVGATFVGAAFIGIRTKIHHLYFWNMAGSGLGGFLILGLMYLLPPDRLIAPLSVVAGIVALVSAVRLNEEEERYEVPYPWLAGAVVALILSVSVSVLGGQIHVSQFKPISYARDFPDAKEVYHSYGPTGEFQVYQSSYFHFAPGLSDNAGLNLSTMPKNAFEGLYIDGEGPIGIMRKLKPAEAGYLDYLPMAAPYLLMHNPRVLLLGLGGGTGVFDALYHSASEVSVVEADPALIHMLRDVPYFRTYTGDVLRDPRVNVIHNEPRAYSAATNQRYDLVEISLIDSVGLSQPGGYQLDENYTYTTQGIHDYLHTLANNGVLSITVWNRLSPPRNVPKLLTTVVQSLQNEKVADPGSHIFAFGLLDSTATVLVKRQPFTAQEISTLLDFCERMSFKPYWYAGMPDPGKNFSAILAAYKSQFQTSSTATANGATANPGGGADANLATMDLLPSDLYYYTVKWMLTGKTSELYRQYLFNIRAVTDNRPYYTGYVKPSTLSLVVRNIKSLSEEWGYLLLAGTFLISLIFGALIILVPMVGRWRELFKRRPGTVRVILYYALLGIGYMMVEIFLIQRLDFFLANPIFSNSIVITSMLIISGAGSLVAGRFRENRSKVVAVAAAGIAASMLLYAFVLPSLLEGLLGLPLLVKMVIAIVAIAPGAFCLGIPFPTGLSALTEARPGLLPWAWGLNGALSVTGAVLAKLVSISAGFDVVLIGVAVLYLLAALVYSGNEARAVPFFRPGKSQLPDGMLLYRRPEVHNGRKVRTRMR